MGLHRTYPAARRNFIVFTENTTFKEKNDKAAEENMKSLMNVPQDIDVAIFSRKQKSNVFKIYNLIKVNDCVVTLGVRE
jgi:hypothetical protein